MKKIISILLISILALGLVACGDTTQNKTTNENPAVEESNKGTEESNKGKEEENKDGPQDNITSGENKPNEQESVSDSSGMNVLVVYFSVTGNTKTIAEKIATLTDADLYEIKPAVEYTDADIDYGDSNSRTSKEQNDSSARPEIKSETISLEGYDTVYIGYPIWWGEAPRIMDTFVESYDFGDITMIPFCTSASSGIGNSGQNLAKTAGSGNWLEGKRFSANASESELKEWVDDAELHSSDTETKISSSEACSMKLLVNETEIPVIWENNDSVNEIMTEASKGDIIVSMSMYSDNEQVGSLGKSYTRNDKQTTTHNGDIVLYSGSNIVLFYGSNSWAYTRIGKMDLSEAEVTELLSNGNVSVRLTSTQNSDCCERMGT